MAMISIKIAEFRNQLSHYLKKVRAGAEVVITDRDTPIGRVVPYERKREEETFELVPPKNGWGSLSKLNFSPLPGNYGVVADLISQRRKR